MMGATAAQHHLGCVDQHVVRPDSDNPDRVRHTFCVLPRLETSRLASGFYSNTAKRLYPGSPFQQF